MKKNRRLILQIIICFTLLLTVCGCRRDNMEDISIITTNYPNEYIISSLYGKHATISSIYPDGVNTSTYKLTTKRKKDLANQDLLIYTGLIERERNLAVELLDYNSNLKIIDSSYVLENSNNTDELWNDPSFMLMMCQNVRISLKEYVENNYLRKEIDKNYETLKITVSELDADIRLAVENAPYKTIVATSSAYKYLEKYGVKVYLVNDDTSDKDLKEVDNLIKQGKITKIFTYEEDKTTSNVQNIINKYPNVVSLVSFKHMNLLTEEARKSNSDYVTLMNQNLDTLKEELYHGTQSE
ncbi:MAG: metal ABC transporter substrate-binding protein [bacterium]|jgi:periplasmic solute binding protein|nr:metal ABC transporter substrate-binding protein [bacterium]